MTVGELIREYRESHGFSQRQFANVCGLSNGYISMLERGENPKTGKPVTPTLPQLKKLADGMGTTIMDMLEKVDDMPVDIATEAAVLTDQALTGQQTPVPSGEDGRGDALDLEIATLILRLNPDKKIEALKYLRYLADRKED